jgi:hypothetical protein
MPYLRKEYNNTHSLYIHFREHAGDTPHVCTFLGCGTMMLLKLVELYFRWATAYKPKTQQRTTDYFRALTASGPHYLYRLRPGAKACLNYGKPVAH